MKPLLKLIAFALIAVLAAACGTARYARKYPANLQQFASKIPAVQKPQDFGDSIADRIDYSIANNKKVMNRDTRMSLTYMALGTAGSIASPFFTAENNRRLALGISITVFAVYAVDLLVSVPAPAAYNKQAKQVVSAWNESHQDNAALTALRAGLFTLEETWPAFAP